MKVILPLPVTTNHAYGTHGKIRYMTAEAKAWKEMAIYKFKGYKGVNPTEIKITYFLKFNRDVDGSHKLILDAMQERGGGAGVMKDDNTIVHLDLYKFKAKDNPRVEVDFYPQVSIQ